MALELQQQQKQILSQRMIQSVRILQMTSQDLIQYVEDLALENPAMDIMRTAETRSIDEWRAARTETENEHYLTQKQRNDDDYDPKDNWNLSAYQGETLKEHLLSQIAPGLFSGKEARLLDHLLDSLDEKGYLTETAASSAARFGVDEQDAEDLILFLQGLEPAGACARSLEECLRIQLESKGILTPGLRAILEHHLELVAKNKTAAIAGKLKIPQALAAKYCELIRTLDPKPGGRFFHQETVHYIIPDVIVTKGRNGLEVSLSQSSAPSVSVNDYYLKLSRDTEDREVKEYLGNRIRQAEWVRQCISQRQTTMLKISRAILIRQQAFFEKGPAHLLPLRLSDVAEMTELHESTVSRAISQKYLQCCWGTFPMDHFFPRSSVSASSDTQENTQTRDAVLNRIREIIASEDSAKPYSDQKLCGLLEQQGIRISRRTVAKYRDGAGIPDASGRKQHP